MSLWLFGGDCEKMRSRYNASTRIIKSRVDTIIDALSLHPTTFKYWKVHFDPRVVNK